MVKKEKKKTSWKNIINFILKYNPIYNPLIFIILVLLVILSEFFFKSKILTILFVILLIIHIIFTFIFNFYTSIFMLWKPKNLLFLFMGYFIGIISILLMFTLIYSSVDASEKGYLTYEKCSDHFDHDVMKKDIQKSQNYFYFSTVTFFSVGYGDICPMGLSKIVSIVNMWVGHLVTTLFLGIAISLAANKSNFIK